VLLTDADSCKYAVASVISESVQSISGMILVGENRRKPCNSSTLSTSKHAGTNPVPLVQMPGIARLNHGEDLPYVRFVMFGLEDCK
jgi:hypothetical protein